MAHSIKQAVKNKNDELFTPKILVESIYKLVKKLTENKIKAVVLSNAGECCGFKNEDYIKAGAKIVQKLNEIVMKDVSIISFVDFPENKKIFKHLTPRLVTISLIFAFTMFYFLMN